MLEHLTLGNTGKCMYFGVKNFSRLVLIKADAGNQKLCLIRGLKKFNA